MSRLMWVQGPVLGQAFIDVDRLKRMSDNGKTWIIRETFTPSVDNFSIGGSIVTIDDPSLSIGICFDAIMIYDSGIDTSLGHGVTFDYTPANTESIIPCDGGGHSYSYDVGGTSSKLWLNDDGTIKSAFTGMFAFGLRLNCYAQGGA